MGATNEQPNSPGEQANPPIMLFGHDGAWELYPIRQRMQVGKFLYQNENFSKDLVIEPRNHPTESLHILWLGNIVILSFVIMVFIKMTYPRRFFQFFRASMSNKNLHLLLREWNPINIFSLLFSMMHTIGLAMLIYVGSVVFGSPLSFTSGWLADLLLLAGVTTFVLFGKYLTILFLGWLFQLRDSSIRYFANQIVYSFLFSIVLFPVLLSVIYNPTPVTLIASSILLTIILVIRLVRSFAIGLSESRIPHVYLILYLCTLETVPLVLLFKAVTYFFQTTL